MRLSRSTRLFSPCLPIRNGVGSIGTRLRLPDGFVTDSAGGRPFAAEAPDDDISGSVSVAVYRRRWRAQGWPDRSTPWRAEPGNGNSIRPPRSAILRSQTQSVSQSVRAFFSADRQKI